MLWIPLLPGGRDENPFGPPAWPKPKPQKQGYLRDVTLSVLQALGALYRVS